MPIVKPAPAAGVLQTATGATNLTLPCPAGDNGDLIFVMMACRGSVAALCGWDVAGRPAGFTWIVDNEKVGASGVLGVAVQIGWREADGTEPASWNFPGESGSGRKLGTVVRVKNGDDTAIVDASSSGTAAPVTYPSVVAPGANTLWLGFGAWGDVNTPEAQALDTVTDEEQISVSSNASGPDFTIWMRYGIASGATPTVGTTLTHPANGWHTTSIAIGSAGGTDADLLSAVVNTLSVQAVRSLTLLDLPNITGVSPSLGDVAGGTVVTLTGTDFTGVTDVKFGGISATSFTVDSDTQITATTPAHVAGDTTVQVFSPQGDSNAPAFTFSEASEVFGSAALAGTATMTPGGGLAAHGTASLAGTATTTGVGILKQTGNPVTFAGQAYLSASPTLLRTKVGREPWEDESDTPQFQQLRQYRVRIVDYEGTGYADLENATVTGVNEELNGMGGFTFTMPTVDDKAHHVKMVEREAQVWRGDQLIAWGVITRVQADQDVMNVQVAGLRWYFTRRVFGKVDRDNHFKNGSFEHGLNHWEFDYSTIESEATMSGVTVEVIKNQGQGGTRVLKMTQPSDAAPIHAFSARQKILHTITEDMDPDGNQWTAVVWVKIDKDTYRGPHIDGTTVNLQRFSTTETIEICREDGGGCAMYPKLIESIAVPIDFETPKNTWTRVELSLVEDFEVGVTEYIQVMVDCPRGEIMVDEVALVMDEKSAFIDVDQSRIVKGIVEHAQDIDYGKSDLNIDTSCPLTGVNRTRRYFHAEHQIIAEALDEFPTLWDGIDTHMEITPDKRTFTTYYKRKGSRRGNHVLEMGRNIETFSVAYDGEQIANSIYILGDGEGADREEGGARSGQDGEPVTLGGLILEKAYNARPNTKVRTLDAQALMGLKRYQEPVVIPSVTTYEGAGRLIGVLNVGDTVPLRIDWGYIQVNDDYRIIAWHLDPETERITYTLNKEWWQF